METKSSDNAMRAVKSCGFLVMKPDQGFLLMKQLDRFDLPKGHMETGEDEKQTAFRELMEETGIQATDVDVDPNFRFEEIYYPVYERFGGERVKKTLVIFFARLRSDSIQITPTEHHGFQWFSWTSPPAPIQSETVDPLLNQLHTYLTSQDGH